jgi:hypothetical protein
MLIAMKSRKIEKEKNLLAVILGQRGGRARAKKLSAKRRSEIARIAAKARWNKDKKK